MDTRKEKDKYIRDQIISAAKAYKSNLAGKVFLYVCEKFSFEVVFRTASFRHLTGVASELNAEEFYRKAVSAKLTTDQFYYDQTHRYRNAKKKLSCLCNLSKLTNDLVCVSEKYKTTTITYALGVSDLQFTIGLGENKDYEGNKLNDWFIPMTLRVNDKVIENSENADFVDFIFCKDASVAKYTDLTYSAPSKEAPQRIKELLSPNLRGELFVI